MSFILPPVHILSFTGGLNRAMQFGIVQNLSPLTFFGLIDNVFNFLIGLVVTVALAVLVWGGFTYITSMGDEAKSAKAKRTISYSIIGLVVAGAVFLITNTVFVVLGVSGFTVADAINAYVLIFLRLTQIILGPTAAIAVIVLTAGGYMYITSAGDEARVGRAKRIIIYALLGLLVIGLAGIVVNAVVNLI